MITNIVYSIMIRTMLLVFVMLSLCAQAQRGRQSEPIFTQGATYRNTGWFVAPGLTYMLPEYFRRTETGYSSCYEGTDTLYSGLYKRSGRIGIYAEAGRHHFFENLYLIDHIDYGIHFKKLTGRERFDGSSLSGNVLAPAQSEGIFKESFVGAFFNASNIIQLKQKIWLQNSIGVNVDYRIIAGRSISDDSYGAAMRYPQLLLGQLHYKIGVGWKPEPGIYILPMLETPILTAYPWDNGKSTLTYFSGRYRPLILTLRIEWLSMQRGRKCDTRSKLNPSEVSNEEVGKHKHDGLWGPESKKITRSRKKQDGLSRWERLFMKKKKEQKK